MRRRPGRAPSIAYLCKFAKLTEISKEDLILLALPHISSTVQLAVNRGLCKAANCKEALKSNLRQEMAEEISSKSNSIDVVAEFVTLWQMIAVLGVVTTVACCFFLWTAMLIRANLVAWPLAIRERRLKVVRDNEYELIHRYKRELLLNHLFQTPEDEGADDEQNAQQT